MRDKLRRARLWLVTDRAAVAPRSLTGIASAALDSGVDMLVYRDKSSGWETRLGEARELSMLAGPDRFILSHRPEWLGELPQCAGLHLGFADLAGDLERLRDLRVKLPEQMVLGHSAHSIGELLTAFRYGADYAFLGPIFATPSKAQYGPPLGLDAARQALRLQQDAAFSAKTVVLIGGVSRETLPVLAQAAVEIDALDQLRIAVIGAIHAAPDPAAAAAELKLLLS